MDKFLLAAEYKGEKRKIEVRIYPTRKALRKSAKKYNPRENYDNTLGLCHRFVIEKISKNGKVKSKPFCAIVRLSQQDLGVGIISHELAHAAVWINELSNGGKLVAEDDEDFCYLLGDLVRLTVKELYSRKYIS